MALCFQTSIPKVDKQGDFRSCGSWGKEFGNYEHVAVFDPATKKPSVIFRNGGDTVHVLGVCIDEVEDLKSNLRIESVCGSLFHRLESEEDVSVLLIPALAYFGLQMLGDGTIIFEGEPLMSRLLQHCAVMNNRFLMLDAPQHLHDELLVRWVEQVGHRYEKSPLSVPYIIRGFVQEKTSFPPSSVMAECTLPLRSYIHQSVFSTSTRMFPFEGARIRQ